MTIDRSIDDTPAFKRQYSSAAESKRKRRPTDITTYYRCFQNYYHSQHYLMPMPEYVPRVPITVHHWQLRDLIHHDGNDQVLYVSMDSVRAYNERSHVSRVYNHTKYYPRCLDVGPNGSLLIGGLLSSVDGLATANLSCLNLKDTPVTAVSQRTVSGTFHRGMVSRIVSPYASKRASKGLLTYYNPELDIDATYRLGDMINNDVMLHQLSSGLLRAYACNNDTRLYAVDIQTSGKMDVVHSSIVESNTSINSVICNPMHEKLLAVSGDSANIHLLDTHSPNRIKRIRTTHDSGFGMAYQPNNLVFATCFQDGFCSLYDIRNLDCPLKEIKSTRPGHQMGAFRCCKFSSLSVENLLVILEHVGRVHVIDLNNLENSNHQVIVLPQALVQYADYRGKTARNTDGYHSKSQEDIDSDDDDDIGNTHSETTSAVQKHYPISVYDSQNGNFSAPLVYDYDYLVNVNPKLFKNYTYPTTSATAASSYSASNGGVDSLVDFVLPQWYGTPGQPHACEDPDLSPTTPVTTRYIDPVVSSQNYSVSPLEMVPISAEGRKWQLSQYQMEGEVELTGLDWHHNKIYIGHQEGGIMTWDVNSTSLSSRGSFAFA